ncbi:monovalent cation/H+ antiporter complex subunit F [Bogoriella caseilytica]|uniref:Multicomponent Na+:H+ antiporter subunit F n=1 Tax=Bogoriella caseilytica TaxID=56055 RepID=A0A3N2BBN7_9MICO|nr:monovalent cation/H+ antiporter complex subunit F [Bogoriella caseilytica]ROR72679.1 multicomponent Na+:H+ antiporter subunit F [Bogoriella caseilytica]
MITQVTAVVLAICLALLVAAAVLALWRMEKGPTMFDRVVSLDVTTVIVLGGIALITASTGRSDLVPVLAVLAVVGFVGSVAMARFAAAERPEEARILTEAEARELAAQELDDTAAPLHDPDEQPTAGPAPGDAGGQIGSVDDGADQESAVGSRSESGEEGS